MPTWLPIANAELLSVAGGEFSEDFDREAGVPVAKWEGKADALVEEKVRTRSGPTGGGTLDKVKDVMITIPAGLTPAFDIETDDTVTYRYAGGTWSGQVADFDANSIPGELAPAVLIHFKEIKAL